MAQIDSFIPQIKPLSGKILEDFLNFFDNALYTDKPDWQKCYCFSFHYTGPAENWTKEKNRAAVINLIEKGEMKGYLAYAGKKPVGWCNANDRNNYQRLLKYYDLLDAPGNKICSVVCFLIHPDFRRKGISKAFLDRISEDYTSQKYDYIEAYPGKNGFSSGHHYKGTLPLYENIGFHIEKEHKNYYTVRKLLQ